MSTRDREILKAARVTQKKVADLFGITLQGVNRGVGAESHYLTAERLGKLVDLLEQTEPEKADTLRSSLHKIVENTDEIGVKTKTSYVQVQTFRDILKREQEDLIWMPVDPLTRIIEEVDALQDYIRTTEQRLIIITCEPVDDLRAVLDERIYQFNFNTLFKGRIVVIHSESSHFTPEMLLASKAVFAKTVFGFQMLRENEGNVVLNRFFKATKISPNYLPIKLGDGYTKTLQYSCLPFLRELTYLLNDGITEEEIAISPELLRYLKTAILNIERTISLSTEKLWAELCNLADDIKPNYSPSDSQWFSDKIEYLKLKHL